MQFFENNDVAGAENKSSVLKTSYPQILHSIFLLLCFEIISSGIDATENETKN